MTAWLLTWLWQGSALAAGVAVALRCAPRLNAATRHLIWCVRSCGSGLARVGQFTVRRSRPPAAAASVSRTPSMSRQRPTVLITIFVGIWAAIALVSLLRLLPGLRAVYALRDRCRPFPPTSNRGFRCGSKRRRAAAAPS